MNLKCKSGTFQVSTLAEASKVFCRERDKSGLGCSKWGGGLVTDDNAIIGYASYNGRIWAEDYRLINGNFNAVPIYDNRQPISPAQRLASVNKLRAAIGGIKL